MKTLSTEHINLKFFSLVMAFNAFFLVALFATILFAGPKSSEAKTTSAQAGSSIYYANISNEDTVTIPVVPTSSQAEYTATNEITFSSTCTAGSYIYINTNSTTDNALTRTGSDTGTKTINAVAGDATSGLTDNTWGFKTNGKAFTQVPVSTSPAVLYSSTKAETNTPVEVIYGVKTDNNLPSGTYTNDVVYTVVVDNKCLQYTLKFDTQGGSAISDTTVNYGDTVDLTGYTTTRSGYIFGGWSNGSLDFTGSETTADPNPSNDFTVTLSACWVKQGAYAYDYTGGEQTFTAPCNGYYKLEVWGAQGGDANGQKGGYGAYSVGATKIIKSSALKLNIGGKGATSVGCSSSKPGGYNGGGLSGREDNTYQCDTSYYGSGGGATHIATTAGLLKDLSSATDRAKIIIVAGGGGGAHYYGKSGDGNASTGGHGGGFQGGIGSQNWASHVCKVWACTYPGVSTQTNAGAIGYHTSSSGKQMISVNSAGFGYGTSWNGASMAAGGGGGYYGGSAGGQIYANGGSGYIGSSNLISGGGITKHMTCYSCTTSTAAATRTNSNTTTPSAAATADVAKLNNGYAKITYIGPTI